MNAVKKANTESPKFQQIVETATANRFAIEDISVAKPSLGDVFLKYTGRQLRDK